MAAVSLKQIKHGEYMYNKIADIIRAYPAATVTTTISKPTGQSGEDNGQYTAEELFQLLQAKINEIAGSDDDDSSDSTSLASLKASIDEIANKTIKDIVRVAGKATYAAGTNNDDGTYTITFTEDSDGEDKIAELVPDMDDETALRVYLLDNTSVFDTDGAQLTYSFKTKKFSGTPAILDVDESKKDEAEKLVYKALNKTFDFKVFPTGKFTISTIPEDYLLDNAEMQLVAYDEIINKIIVDLAKDSALIESIKELVGEQAVQDQLEDLKNELQEAIDGKISKDDILDKIGGGSNSGEDDEDGDEDDYEPSTDKVPSEKAVSDALKEIEDKITSAGTETDSKIQNLADRLTGVESVCVPVIETFTISSADVPTTTFNLKSTPNSSLVKMYINSLMYLENQEFTVDRETKTITWTYVSSGSVATDTNDGFDITTALTDKVTVEYHTGELVSNTSALKVLHSDTIPTVGDFKVGDMVFRVTPISTSNLGWICSKAGKDTAAEWTTFGVVDFEHTIYPSEN